MVTVKVVEAVCDLAEKLGVASAVRVELQRREEAGKKTLAEIERMRGEVSK